MTVAGGAPVYVMDGSRRTEIVSAAHAVYVDSDPGQILFTRKSDGTKFRVKVPQLRGAQFQALHNFRAAGSSIGQDFDLAGATQERSSSSGSHIVTERCYQGDWYGNQQFRVESVSIERSFELRFVRGLTTYAVFKGVYANDSVSSSREPIGSCDLIGRTPVYEPTPDYPRPDYPHNPGEPNPPARPIDPTPDHPHRPGEPNPPARPIRG